MSAQKSGKQAPTSALNLSLKHFLASGTYSDLTLVCGGKEFCVHKIILDAQSTVFHKLLNGSFKETGKSRIETIDVRAVPALVEAVRMVDELTPPSDKTLWKIVLPLMTGNITFLLGDQDFKDLLQDMPQLMYELLAHLDPGYSERSEAANLQAQLQTGSMTGSIPFPRPRAAFSEDEADSLDDGDDLSHFPGYHGTFGAGRRLG
ncbi:hypothetical protein KC345_g7335 [Hortaea werneckii]|nr:hypothetical protein KC345_g7335 [Hortaea werneckii]